MTKSAKKAAPVKPTGRPSSFTTEIGDLICDRISDGESLRKICEINAMPSRATVFRWLANDENVAFRDQYARAREASADADADDISHYAREAAAGRIEAAQARAAIDGLKWSAGKRQPKKYGDKLDLDHSSSDGSMSPKPNVIVFEAPGVDAGED